MKKAKTFLEMKNDPMDFYIKQLNKHVGWTITSVVKTPFGDDEGFFGLELTNPDQTMAVLMWILRDDEGNGHGSFDIEATKVRVAKAKVKKPAPPPPVQTLQQLIDNPPATPDDIKDPDLRKQYMDYLISGETKKETPQ